MPALLSSEQFFKILDSMPDHVFIFSKDAVYLHVFGGVDNHVGSDCKQYQGLTLYEAMPEDMAGMFHDYIKETLRTQQTQYVKYHFTNQHMQVLPFESDAYGELWVEGILKPFTMESGEDVVIWTARNVTEKHYLELKLKELADIDALTGVLNRRAFILKMTELVDSVADQTAALLMFDIDFFKKVNDTFGHNAGDCMIKHVIDVIGLELRDSDIIGRIGGEEFAVILHHTTARQALNIAERLCLSIENTPCYLDDEPIFVTVSIGIAQINADEFEYKYVFQRADKAMYHSKRNGRNCVTVFEPTLMEGRI